jgi:hypothetical protein
MVCRIALFAVVAAMGLATVHITSTPAEARAIVNLKMKQAQSLYNKNEAASTASPKGHKIWHSGNFRFSGAWSRPPNRALLRSR